jgi:hypothetical protein
MANKTQAKAAIDAVVVLIKAEIDNISPVGSNIQDGFIGFNPTKFQIVYDAGGNLSTANSWKTSIETALTAASRVFITDPRRRQDDNKVIVINAGQATHIIRNF